MQFHIHKEFHLLRYCLFYHIFLHFFLQLSLFPQFVILVVDSIDRERLSVTKEELYRMLAHEVFHLTLTIFLVHSQDLYQEVNKNPQRRIVAEKIL